MRSQIFAVACLLTLYSCAGATNPEADVIIETEFGNIELKLYDDTPKHKENFLKLVKEGFYDGTTFHRVIDQFMVQGGDPNTRDPEYAGPVGQGGPGYTIPAEFNPKHLHVRGALAAARQGDQVNPQRESSGSQFYIVVGKPVSEQELLQIQNGNIQQALVQSFAAEYLSTPERQARVQELQGLQQSDPEAFQAQVQAFNQEVLDAFAASGKKFEYTLEQKQAYAEKGGTPFLDMQYTVFGEVVSGMDVVDKIAKAQKDRGDKPLEDIRMKMRVVE